jgi:glucose/arabinose dehydrogenase
MQTFRWWRKVLSCWPCCVLLAAPPADALQAVLVGSGYTQPLLVTAPIGDNRLFVVEKGGLIRVQDGSTVSTFLDLRPLVDSSGERGLLGLAFDPAYASNGRFYVDYIDATTRNTVVAAYTVSTPGASVADAGSARLVLTVPQPAGLSNHKAGWIGFSPADPGRLYIATGDGGGSNDPGNRAQNLADNLGKLLRVVPLPGGGYTVPADNPFAGAVAGNDEIWAYGLRNPFRNSFDRLTGDLWIGDVGQSLREEIDFAAAGSAGGVNYGWRAREGSIDNPAVGDAAPAGAVGPLFDYAHGTLGASVIGGHVYRGTGEPGLDGSYLFGDFVSGRIFTLRRSGSTAVDFTDRTAELGTPFGGSTLASFGEDGHGNLYAVGLNGNIFRVASAVPEPGAWALLLAGLLAGGRRWRDLAGGLIAPGAVPQASGAGARFDPATRSKRNSRHSIGAVPHRHAAAFLQPHQRGQLHLGAEAPGRPAGVVALPVAGQAAKKAPTWRRPRSLPAPRPGPRRDPWVRCARHRAGS